MLCCGRARRCNAIGWMDGEYEITYLGISFGVLFGAGRKVGR